MKSAIASFEMFQEEFKKLKVVEAGKDQLIENLILRVKELENGLREEKLHLEREQTTSKAFQSSFSDVTAELRQRDQDIDSNSFVSVLIDGDGMTFLDHLVKSTKQGGLDAARQLKSAVCEYVSKQLELPRLIQIRIRIYANKKGLASAYCYNQILETAGDLDTFVRGFNMGDPMCDFVDAGDGKECADSKLKALFKRDLADVQCRAVMFGGSADNSYAPLLRAHAGDGSKNNRIILVEGPPFAKELVDLKDQFLITRFSEIFRSTKLRSRPSSLATTSPPTPTPSALSYAATIGTPVNATPIRASTTGAAPALRSYPVLKNSRGQRLDAVLSAVPSLVYAQRDKKLCNQYHILGECSYISCTFVHGRRLDENGIKARRLLARSNPCLAGLQCRDEKCLAGHECPDRACAKIGNGCRFPREMHGVDRT